MGEAFRNKAYDVFNMFDRQWGLATAGTIDDFDGCTIGWGSLGDIWGGVNSGRMIATIYVHPDRLTCEYLMKHQNFSVSFFSEDYREDILLLGTKSKRDCDKFAETKLTAQPHLDTVVFHEARLTFVCKKLYQEQFKFECMLPEVKNSVYRNGRVPHYQFIGEIIDVIDTRG